MLLTNPPKSIIINGVEYSYREFTLENRDVPIWSNGTFDGSGIEKIIGYEHHPPICRVILENLSRIIFDTYQLRDDGAIIVERFWEVTTAFEP